MQAKMPYQSADYIIVGGGLCGLTLAHRLSKDLPDSSSVLVIEAGCDPRDNANLHTLSGLMQSRGPDCKEDWNFHSEPSKTLNDRVVLGQAGKALGGSGNVNFGVWLRGNATDWDTYARLVGDDAWSYQKMLPFFRKTENLQNTNRDRKQHGYDGYIKVTQSNGQSPRKPFPLYGSVKKAWSEVGVEYIGDPNTGRQNGLAEHSDAWIDGKRQFLVDVLDLSKVKLMTDTYVRGIDIEQRGGKLVAIGIDLGGDMHVRAKKEVIVCAGAYQSPKLLMLSGIGDKAQLQKFGITPKLHQPEVGQNLSDHLGMCIQWRLKHPEEGLAIGSPALTDPSYYSGYPSDLVYHGRVRESAALSALIHKETDRDIVMRPGGSHIEIFTQYLPMGPEAESMGIYPDGSHISTCSLVVSPMSRGHVALTSANPEAPPYIDRNYNHAEADLHIHREAMRLVARVMLETEAGKAFVDGEAAPEGAPLITSTASDQDLNERIRSGTFSISHPMGTCAMGTVVDARCKVKGVEGLRVADASILPVPHSAPLQPAVYAIAERLAAFIVDGE